MSKAADRAPWIYFHLVWKARGKSGLPLLAQVQNFVAAIATEPAPSQATLSIHEDLGEPMRRLTREVPSDDATGARALAAIGYRPGPVVEAAQASFGPGVHRRWASGSTGFLYRWEWTWRAPVALDAALAFYRQHEGLPAIDGMPAVGLSVSFDFALKRPGTAVALYPDSHLGCAATVHVETRHANIGIRYDTPEDTAEFRELHRDVAAAFGPKLPRHALVRVVPSTRPGGRDRTIQLA